MDLADIQKNYPAIRAAANDLLTLLGPEFTNKPDGHVETDIAAAASLAGLSMLRSKGFDLREFTPGSMLLSEMDTEMNEIWHFMMAAAGNLGWTWQEDGTGKFPRHTSPSIPSRK